MGEGRYRTLLCLIQLAVPDDAGSGEPIALIDPLAEEPARRAGWRRSRIPRCEIVVHAGRQDIALLRRELRCEVTNVFDTQVAAGFAGLGAQASYDSLLDRRARPARGQDGELHALGCSARSRPSSSTMRARTSCTCSTSRRELEAAPERARSPAVGARGVPRRSASQRRARPAGDLRPAAAGRRAERRPRAPSRASSWSGASARPSARTALCRACSATPAWSRSRAAAPPPSEELGRIRGVGAVASGPPRARSCSTRSPARAAPPGRAAPAGRAPAPPKPEDLPLVALSEALVRTRAREAGLAYELLAARADLQAIVAAVRLGEDRPTCARCAAGAGAGRRGAARPARRAGAALGGAGRGDAAAAHRARRLRHARRAGSGRVEEVGEAIRPVALEVLAFLRIPLPLPDREVLLRPFATQRCRSRRDETTSIRSPATAELCAAYAPTSRRRRSPRRWASTPRWPSQRCR